MEFILQTYNKDNQKLLADGPVTKSNAVLIYSDNTPDLKMKILMDGTRDKVATVLASLFKITSLGDKTVGIFKFDNRQTNLGDILKGDGSLNEDDIDDQGVIGESKAEGRTAEEMEDREKAVQNYEDRGV